MILSNRPYHAVLVLLLLWKEGSCCPYGWTIYRNSCYHVSRDSQNWFNAMKMCEIHESYLVHIDDAEEQVFITNLLQSSSANNTWLGATDWTVEGSWHWEPHGSKLNYTNFAPGQPNNFHSQNCLLMDRLHHYQWNDLECLSLTRHYVCERREHSGIIFGK